MLTENEKPITIAMLAHRIGVSVATVSSVLNNRYKQRRISPKTVRKVQEAAVEAGYLPNVAARRLRSGYSNQYLVLAAITSYQAPLPLVSGTITALHRLLSEEKYRNIHSMVTVEMFDAGKLSELPGLLDGSRFNGAIIANTIAEDDTFLATNQFSIPVVLMGRNIPNYSSVRASAEKTGQQAADILISAESRQPAVLYAKLLTQTTSGRLKGFTKRISELLGKEPVEMVADGFGEKDGYKAVQLGFMEAKRLNSPEKGHLKTTGRLLKHLREFAVDDGSSLEVGQKIDVGMFQPGDLIDVCGVSKGKGFAGGVKRYHFGGGPKTHGQSDRHRAPGSIGATTYPGRVIKGTRMAGRMGGDRVTARHLQIVQVDVDRNLLLVKGAVPGAPNAIVMIRKSGGG